MAAAGGGATAVAEKAVTSGGSAIWGCCKGIFRCFSKLFGLFTACIKRLPLSAVSLLLRVLNIGNAVLLAAACVFIFMKASQEGVKLSVTQVRTGAAMQQLIGCTCC